MTAGEWGQQVLCDTRGSPFRKVVVLDLGGLGPIYFKNLCIMRSDLFGAAQLAAACILVGTRCRTAGKSLGAVDVVDRWPSTGDAPSPFMPVTHARRSIRAHHFLSVHG